MLRDLLEQAGLEVSSCEVTSRERRKPHFRVVTAVATKSPHSLYEEDLATFGESQGYCQADSKGFVKLYGLPGMVTARIQGEQQS